MASIFIPESGFVRIQFTGLDGKRKAIYPGKLSRKSAEKISDHLDELISAKSSDQTIPKTTMAWLAGTSRKIRLKLAEHGLIDPEQTEAPGKPVLTLSELCQSYLASRADLKAGTRVAVRVAFASLLEYFKPARDVTTINQGDALDFSRKLAAEGLAQNTVKRRCGQAKTLFRWAKLKGFTPANPFDVEGLPTSTKGNKGRMCYVSVEMIGKVIDACPDAEFRCVLALARHAGLRVPSEILPLRWGDFFWDEGTFRVKSPKTERYPDGAERIVPIFPALRPYLDELYAVAPEGSTFLITRNRGDEQMANGISCNWRTRLERLIEKASVVQWPRLYNNLRSSCAIDLNEKFPSHVVCAWLGHDPEVERQHYLNVLPAHYQQATGLIESSVKSFSERHQKPACFSHSSNPPRITSKTCASPSHTSQRVRERGS